MQAEGGEGSLKGGQGSGMQDSRKRQRNTLAVSPPLSEGIPTSSRKKLSTVEAENQRWDRRANL